MTNRAELLPCPFCNLDVTSNEGVFPTHTNLRQWEVRCGNPGCFAHDPCGETREAAILKWNRRATRGDAELLALAERISAYAGPQRQARLMNVRADMLQGWAERLRAIAAQPVGSALEELSESDKDVALGQAVEFAEYVVNAANGSMVERAQDFMSLPYSQEIAARLKPQPTGLPELPPSFARICDDGYWLARTPDTARFHVHDMRDGSAAQEVYSADQMRDYAARAAGVDALDAARYRYLRNLPLGPLSGSEFTEGLCVDMWSGDGSGEQIRGDSLDAAIDAAISEQAGEIHE